jgi:hypothetical protein
MNTEIYHTEAGRIVTEGTMPFMGFQTWYRIVKPSGVPVTKTPLFPARANWGFADLYGRGV